jgi:hypothetical protein
MGLRESGCSESIRETTPTTKPVLPRITLTPQMSNFLGRFVLVITCTERTTPAASRSGCGHPEQASETVEQFLLGGLHALRGISHRSGDVEEPLSNLGCFVGGDAVEGR